MAKYSKAIGATLGALVAWGVVLGIPMLSNIDVAQVSNIIMLIGGLVGTYIAPKNADA